MKLRHGEAITAMHWHPRLPVLFTVARNYWGGLSGYWDEGTIKAWSTTTGRLLKTMKGAELQFLPDGKTLLVRELWRVSGWDLDTLRSLWSVDAFNDRVNPSPDSRLIAVARYDTSSNDYREWYPTGVRVLDVRTGAVKATMATNVLAEWSSDSARLLMAHADELRIHDSQTGKLLHSAGAVGRVVRLSWMGDDFALGEAEETLVLRVSDGAYLRVAPVRNEAHCGVLVYHEDGRYDGHEHAFDGIAFRLGDDWRRSQLVTGGPLFDQHRVKGLFEQFLRGK